MTSPDTIARAAKRQRTDAESSSPSMSLHSRVLRTVKQAVYGKASNAVLEGLAAEKRGFGKDVTPGKYNMTPPDKGNEEEAIERRNTLHQDHDMQDVIDDDNPRAGLIPSNEGSEGRRKSSKMANGQHGTKVDTPEAKEPAETPSKKKRKKYKGWAWLDDEDELSINNQEQFEKIAEAATSEAKKSNAETSEERASRALRQRTSLPSIELENTDTRRGSATKSSGRKRKRKEEEPAIATATASVVRNGENLDNYADRMRPENPITKDLSSHATQYYAITQRQESTDRKTIVVEAIPSVAKKKQGRRSSTKAHDHSPFDIVEEAPIIPSATSVVDDLALRDQGDIDIDKRIANTIRDVARTKQAMRLAAKDDIGSPFKKTEGSPTVSKGSPGKVTELLSDHATHLQGLLEEDQTSLAALKAHLLAGLTGQRRLSLVNLETEHETVHQVVEQTVLAGEGNSMLIIGSRGSGKTTLVETVVSELSSANKDEFHVVRLNGFIHTDDKLALREIWRQLGRQMEAEVDVIAGRSNYADTLTSLLALLSHQDESQEALTAKSVIFILDEFDLFASHPRQTLLYNLFDVAQSRNAPIAVLGLTTKVNVVDSLEKRVKSRFGQRYVHLSLPKSFQAFKDFCVSALTYHPPPSTSFTERLHPSAAIPTNLSTAWNTYIHTLFASPALTHHLNSIYTTTKTPSTFLSSFLLPLHHLFSPTTPPSPPFPDNKLALLPSLSTLALSLLIAAARLDIILSTDLCTFQMVYAEYISLASRSRLTASAAGQMAVGGVGRVWGVDIARGEWERLARLELVLPAAGRGEMWRCDVGLEEVGVWVEGEGRAVAGAGLGKWCREI